MHTNEHPSTPPPGTTRRSRGPMDTTEGGRKNLFHSGTVLQNPTEYVSHKSAWRVGDNTGPAVWDRISNNGIGGFSRDNNVCVCAFVREGFARS
eukprot:1372970-Amphidinium_carterae.1